LPLVAVPDAPVVPDDEVVVVAVEDEVVVVEVEDESVVDDWEEVPEEDDVAVETGLATEVLDVVAADGAAAVAEDVATAGEPAPASDAGAGAEGAAGAVEPACMPPTVTCVVTASACGAALVMTAWVLLLWKTAAPVSRTKPRTSSMARISPGPTATLGVCATV
jgi:hypothetical protein